VWLDGGEKSGTSGGMLPMRLQIQFRWFVVVTYEPRVPPKSRPLRHCAMAQKDDHSNASRHTAADI
jgi:hypothetical protein